MGFWSGLAHGTLMSAATLAALSLALPGDHAGHGLAGPAPGAVLEASARQSRGDPAIPAGDAPALGARPSGDPIPGNAPSGGTAAARPALQGTQAPLEAPPGPRAAAPDSLPPPVGSEFRRAGNDVPVRPAPQPAPAPAPRVAPLPAQAQAEAAPTRTPMPEGAPAETAAPPAPPPLAPVSAASPDPVAVSDAPGMPSLGPPERVIVPAPDRLPVAAGRPAGAAPQLSPARGVPVDAGARKPPAAAAPRQDRGRPAPDLTLPMPMPLLVPGPASRQPPLLAQPPARSPAQPDLTDLRNGAD